MLVMTISLNILDSALGSKFIDGMGDELKNQLWGHLPQLLSDRFHDSTPKCIQDTYYGVNNLCQGMTGLWSDYSQGELSLSNSKWKLWQVTCGLAQVAKAAQRTPIGECLQNPAVDIAIGAVGILGTAIGLKAAIVNTKQAHASLHDSEMDQSDAIRRLGQATTAAGASFYGFQRNINRICDALGYGRNIYGSDFVSLVQGFLSNPDGPLIIPGLQGD
ncbi:MAG: hypothetical protein KDK78_04905 [Chlamydiia bacterium]|nr:hypothetical protein [Chlamydiia bacterium]